MADPAVWYLVLGLVASPSNPPGNPPTLVGPVTKAECQQALSGIGHMPSVMGIECKKAIGMQAIAAGPVGYAVPIFEGELTVTAGPR